MGWWKINGCGGIDFSHRTGNGLVNAIPGEHTTENHYNGDGPADIMDLAIVQMRAIQPNITRNEARLAFFENKGDTEIIDIMQKARLLIENLYVKTWERKPYPEEYEAVFDFCGSVWD